MGRKLHLSNPDCKCLSLTKYFNKYNYEHRNLNKSMSLFRILNFMHFAEQFIKY